MLAFWYQENHQQCWWFRRAYSEVRKITSQVANLVAGFPTTPKEPWRYPYEKGQYTQVGNVSIISCSRPNIDAKPYMGSRRQRLAELFVNYASARASLSMK